jgi:hypothetical protein
MASRAVHSKGKRDTGKTRGREGKEGQLIVVATGEVGDKDIESRV